MDMDLLKSTTEDQMEMMMMMMQMEKLPEFDKPYPDITELPSIDFSNVTPPPILNNTPITCPSLINQTSFTSSIVQSPVSSLQNLITRRIPNSRELELSGIASDKQNSVAAMREMIFRIAAMQPIHIDPESVKPPKRKNVKISKDPQSVAARHRRERISERIRILQRLVPGGTKMDTASMLDEAIHYVKFLKTQVQSLERVNANRSMGIGYSGPISNPNYNFVGKAYQPDHMFSTNQMLS